MTQEDKELLLKDLCARIPYGVKGCCEGETLSTTPLCWYAEHTLEYSVNYMVIKNEWRPYLFPLSSMTEEQKRELEQIKNNEDAPYYHDINDFFLKYHLDNRHLIEKGLAIDATGLNIY